MQQATCAHSGADTGTSSGNHDDLSRRAIFAGVAGAAALLALTPALADAGGGAATWAALMARYVALKHQTEQLWNEYKGRPSSTRKTMLGEQVERASEVETEVWRELMAFDAPHLAALCWKLEQVLVDEGEDHGYSASWRMDIVRPVVRDARRLAGAA